MSVCDIQHTLIPQQNMFPFWECPHHTCHSTVLAVQLLNHVVGAKARPAFPYTCRQHSLLSSFRMVSRNFIPSASATCTSTYIHFNLHGSLYHAPLKKQQDGYILRCLINIIIPDVLMLRISRLQLSRCRFLPSRFQPPDGSALHPIQL